MNKSLRLCLRLLFLTEPCQSSILEFSEALVKFATGSEEDLVSSCG